MTDAPGQSPAFPPGDPATALPEGVRPYKRTPDFTEATLPEGLRRAHSTKPGVWGLIRVEAGRLAYRIADDRRRPSERILSPETPPGVVEPEILHEVEPLGSVRFFVEFNREPRIPS